MGPNDRLHVSRDSLDAALMLPAVAARQLGVVGLSPECQACNIHQVVVAVTIHIDIAGHWLR